MQAEINTIAEQEASRAHRNYRRHGVERDDLVQEAWLAGLEAWRRFNPDRGVPFHGYARRGVRLALHKYICRQAAPVSVSSHRPQKVGTFRGEELVVRRPGDETSGEERFATGAESPERAARRLRVARVLVRAIHDRIAEVARDGAAELVLLDGLPATDAAIAMGEGVREVRADCAAIRRRLRADRAIQAVWQEARDD